MAAPNENSRDIPLRVTNEGDAAITAEAARIKADKNEVIRIALGEYFARLGKTINFTPGHGGKRKRMTERETIDQVQARIRALGLPEPKVELKVRFKTYDLAWPDRQSGLEIAQKQRPKDSNGWKVGWIKPGMSNAEIDAVLKRLLAQ